MPTGNLETVEPLQSETPPALPFLIPADYYSAPLSELRPLFPRWVPIGCGSAAAVFLVLLLVGGSLVTGPAFGQVLDVVLGMTLGELRGMYSAEIAPADRQRFETEVERMRQGLRDGNVPVQRVQPFLKSMQEAVDDKKVTAGELRTLTAAATKATS